MRAYEITESRQQLDEIFPAIWAGLMWIFRIASLLLTAAWMIPVIYALYNVGTWIYAAYEWLAPYLDTPIVQFLLKYKLPIIVIAAILYGGNKLYQTIKDAKDEEELKELLTNFKADREHIADIEKQLATMKAKAA